MKYLVWRSGRPRWSPGAGVRAKGFKGQDLRYPSGEWMRLGDAMTRAKELNDAADIASAVPRDIAEREANEAALLASISRSGYVYFLFSGQRVKIGFSMSPLRRAASIGPASGQSIDMFAFVPGTTADERDAHRLLAANRIEGEWFYASQLAMNLILRSIRNRKITLDTTLF